MGLAVLSDEAGPGQILMSARAFAAAEHQVEGERIPDLKLKGFAKPVMAFSVKRTKPGARGPGAGATAAGRGSAAAD